MREQNTFTVYPHDISKNLSTFAEVIGNDKVFRFFDSWGMCLENAPLAFLLFFE